MSSATRHVSLRASLGIAAAVGFSLGVAMSSVALAQAPAPARPAPARPAQAQAPAQQQQQARPAAPAGSGPLVVQVKGAPNSPDWTKQCGRDEAAKAEVCLTVREFVSEDNQPALAVAMYDIRPDGGKTSDRQLRFLLPLMLSLDTGIRFSVDSSAYVPGKFQVCMPNGCFANVAVKDDLLKNMRSGKTFNVAARNAGNAEIVFAIPAEGFAKAFDGPAVDPKVLEERQKQMEQDLQRRSEQMRKDLENRGSAGMPAPAPAAPAANPAAPRQ